MATVSDDTYGIIWDIETGAAINKLSGHKNQVYGVAFHPDGHLAATCAFDLVTIIWDIRVPGQQPHKVTQLGGHEDDIIGVDFDESGYYLATGSDDHTCSKYQLQQLISHYWFKEFGISVLGNV